MDTFSTHKSLAVGDRTYRYASLPALAEQGFDLSRLPFSMKILLENLLRLEDGLAVTKGDIEAIAGWDAAAEPSVEIAFTPARVLLQDFTGVPAVVDLAAMRDAVARLGGDPKSINPGQPVELVIDHSVQVDKFASPDAKSENARIEFERNRERYLFLRWGQQAFDNFKVVPPDTGIVHQVNLEYLARGVMPRVNGQVEDVWAYPDTLVGTDSHTTMINGLGVLGWGVGGIEAEAAMLGQPVSMLVPQVVGFKLVGALPEGSTATDLVLRVVELLREHNVVGKFVEYYGPGLESLSLADRATIANMAPEYGATCGLFPVDAVTLDYLRFSGRSAEQVALVEAYMRAQGLFHTSESAEATYTSTLELDLGTVQPALAGPKRPQDRILITDMKPAFEESLPSLMSGGESTGSATGEIDGETFELNHGSVVIAAITSCTNTSNPSVMVAAGLVAKKAVELGLSRKPFVKTSLAPGSKVVTDYLTRAGLTPYLQELGFHTVGYGCTTCIGNSGPLPAPVAKAIQKGDLVATSVLSGNRNFEGRIHQLVRANYLASPPLVVAYALAGRVDFDTTTEPLGEGTNGPVYLKDVWPTAAEVRAAVESGVQPEMYTERYDAVYEGPDEWRALDVPSGDTYAWDSDSTYVQEPPYFEGMTLEPEPFVDIANARVLALCGDSVTTDHISPAGAIKPDSPAGRYLTENGVEPADFNSYGSRRGNHEVMMRGTFANVRFKNRLAEGGIEGGFTTHQPSDEGLTIYDAAMRYRDEGVQTIVIAGKEYGTGSSRDWAAKGPLLLGVRAVIVESYERIHRSNLVGMGVVPLQFLAGENAETLGLTGGEAFTIDGLSAGLESGFASGREVTVRADGEGGTKEFRALVRIDTPQEVEYVKSGGILHYVLRRLATA